jgi:hypothetical protein
LYSYEAEFIQNLLPEKKKSLAAAFNSTFWYFDDKTLLCPSENFVWFTWKS